MRGGIGSRGEGKGVRGEVGSLSGAVWVVGVSGDGWGIGLRSEWLVR